MLYLTGSKAPAVRDAIMEGKIGLLNTPRNRYLLEGVRHWAADNGCFTDAYPGDDKYLAWLDRLAPHQDRCLFVAAPDVVGDATATLRRGEEMIPRIKARGWPVALELQDGMLEEQIPWSSIDWVFVGGSTEFKLGPDAARLVAAAKQRGVRCHVGRVNSARRYRKFALMGCDSADGTLLAFGPDVHLPRVLSWVDRWHNEGRLFDA